ncbi:MAG: 50S ribosomal protein L17 [Erysipelotrichales bacterium]|nr:50S ribosomal protein L17 [Erysipelotrichales bacterium]
MWNRKFGRKADHRKAMLRNQATDLILKGKIETTEMKAMDLRSVVDELITLGKKGDLASRRLAASYLKAVTNKDGKTAVSVLFDELAPKYADRSGGYTKVSKTYFRKGDNAPMAIIELN